MKRLYYLDNLRVFLTLLVVVFHTSIAYGAAGSWIYKDFDENHGVTLTIAVLSIFTAVCQAFFMSLFFFISAYFTPASYDRKGPAKFMKDRLIRLGLPLVVYYFGIGPLTDWFAKFREKEPLATFYTQKVLHFEWTFFGPTWFIETLIYFAIVYCLVRLFRSRQSNRSSELQSESRMTPFPSGAALFVFAVLFGVIAFAVRLIYPTGTGVLELQFGYFPLYLLAMYAGIKAYRNHWLDNIPPHLARVWKRIGIAMIPVFPIGLILTGALNGHMTFAGGLNFQALMYALWEPFVCFGISIGLIVYFQRRWNVTNKLLKVLSDTAYTVYIIHPPIVVGWTMLFHQVHLPEFVKLIIVAPMNVLSCVLVSYFICKIPYAKKVL